MTAVIRAMRANDLEAVLVVQAACYPPALQEAADVVHGRWRASPGTVWVAEDAGGICAYLFAYPSRLGKVTPLGGAFEIPAAPDVLYLHDLAVAPRVAGQGWGRRLVVCMPGEARGRGLPHLALVSLQGARDFWESLGYAPYQGATDGVALATYPDHACYMTRAVSPR